MCDTARMLNRVTFLKARGLGLSSVGFQSACSVPPWCCGGVGNSYHVCRSVWRLSEREVKVHELFQQLSMLFTALYGVWR